MARLTGSIIGIGTPEQWIPAFIQTHLLAATTAGDFADQNSFLQTLRLSLCAGLPPTSRSGVFHNRNLLKGRRIDNGGVMVSNPVVL
jgi:hypothetical protein